MGFFTDEFISAKYPSLRPMHTRARAVRILLFFNVICSWLSLYLSVNMITPEPLVSGHYPMRSLSGTSSFSNDTVRFMAVYAHSCYNGDFGIKIIRKP